MVWMISLLFRGLKEYLESTGDLGFLSQVRKATNMWKTGELIRLPRKKKKPSCPVWLLSKPKSLLSNTIERSYRRGSAIDQVVRCFESLL